MYQDMTMKKSYACPPGDTSGVRGWQVSSNDKYNPISALMEGKCKGRVRIRLGMSEKASSWR